MASNSGAAAATGQSRKRKLDPLDSGSGGANVEEQPGTSAPLTLDSLVDSNPSMKTMKRRPKFVKPEPDPDFQPSASATKVMSNVLVLKKIAQSLPPKDMFTLRSTCPLWNQSFVPQLKKKHTPLGLKAITDDIDGTGPVSQRRTRSQFIEVFRSSSARLFPFTKYRFEDNFNYNGQTATQRAKLIEIFTELGSSITSLTNVNGLPVRILRKILFEQTGGLNEFVLADNLSDLEEWRTPEIVKLVPLPNLKKLVIYRMSRSATELVNDLLKCATELETLELKIPDNSSLLEALQQTGLQKLKILKIGQPDSDALRILVDLSRREETPLRLECFDVEVSIGKYFRDSNLRIGLLNEFLELQARTLRVLKIDVTGPGGMTGRLDTSIQLPRMERLHTFELVRSDFWRIGVDYEEDSFEHTFPSLQRFGYANGIWYTGMQYDVDNEAGAGILAGDLRRVAHRSVMDLSLTRVSKDSLPAFCTAFPAVIRLHIELNQGGDVEAVHKIWTVWPALEKLSIRAINRDPDPFLVGVSHPARVNKVRMQKLRAELASLPELNLDNLRSLQSKYKTLPGLTDLLHLRHLDFEVCNAAHVTHRVTNIGGYLAFALGPKLQHISVRVRDKYGGRCKMTKRPTQDLDSEECSWFLRSVLGPFAVIAIDE